MTDNVYLSLKFGECMNFLVDYISNFQNDDFDALAMNVSRSEAEDLATRIIENAIVSLNGQYLTNQLEEIREQSTQPSFLIN